jgi:hypothetical protein
VANASLPANTVPPTITGTGKVGQTLTCDKGTWVGAAISYTYRWRKDNTPIIGATATTYVVAAADLGSEITCLVIADNASGTAAELSNVIPVLAALYDYKTVGAVPAAGNITSSALQVRVHHLDKTGLDASEQLRSLAVGDSVIVGVQEGVLTALPIETSGYFILEVAAWPALADGEYYAALKFA